MASYINAILENEEVKGMLQNNQHIIESATQSLGRFYPVMAKYIAENYQEFLGEDLEATKKNVYTFASFATNHFLSEAAAVYGRRMAASEVLREQARTEFI